MAIINGMLLSDDYRRSASGVWRHKDGEDPVAQWLAEELEDLYIQERERAGVPMAYPDKIYFDDFVRLWDSSSGDGYWSWEYKPGNQTGFVGKLTDKKWIESLENFRRDTVTFSDIRVLGSRSDDPDLQPPKDPFSLSEEEEVLPELKPGKREVVAHYTTGEIETIDYIFDKLGYEGGMAYVLGNEIKYSSRANHKGCRRADMIKIRNYAIIAIEKMDKEGELE